MGCYINPENMMKETWLSMNSEMVSRDEVKKFDYIEDKERLPICLVSNPGFTAAAVLYSEHEREAFLDPLDNRFKVFYLCKIEDLKEVSPIHLYLGSQ